MKKKSVLIGVIFSLLTLLALRASVNASTNANSSSEQTASMEFYTLPPQSVGESSKGKGQDRQALGYIMKPGSSLTITNESDVEITIQLLNNNSSAQISQKILPHTTITIATPNPPKPAIDNNGKEVNEAAADVDLVPFILTPRTADTDKKVTCNFVINGPSDKLPIFNYNNNDQSKFIDQWKQSGSYALVSGKDFQILLPVDAQSYVENMDKAPMGLDKNGNPKPTPEGNTYICHNLNDVLHFYDDVLFPTYHQIAGLSDDAKEPYNVLVPGKYFYTADIKGAGGANYSPARTEISGPNDTEWLQPSWVLFHETGHGYQTRELGSVAQHMGEVSNNALGNYMYYHVIYKDNPELADKYSWNYNGNKEAMENDVHKILMDNNWSWDQILPNNGGRGKHVGLILLQNMIEKMSYDGWTEVYKLDRQQIYSAMKNKEKDLDSKLMNIWDLITKAASDHGYDYTAVMTQIGKTPQLPLSQEARDKQNKVVNFLWNLMPNSSYDEVFNVVQQLEKADPNLVFDSNFTLVTPDQMKSLNLNGKLNLTIYDLPSSWSGKTINIMNGNEVYGTLTIGPDGKCSLDNVPLGTYTLAGLPDDYHKLTNYYVTVTNDSAYMNSTDVIMDSSIESSSSSKKSSSSSIKSSAKSSSLKSSSSSKKSSSSSIKSSAKSSSLKSSSSSEVTSSSIKSSASSSSLKSSSSSEVTSSSIKSSAKSSSLKSSSSSEVTSSSIKSSASSSSLKSSSSSEVTSSSIKSSASSSSLKSSSSSEVTSSLIKSSVKISSNTNNVVISSKNPEKSLLTASSNSTNKSSQNTETSVKVPSKASTISYVKKSTQVSVPVVVSSKTNTMAESSISSEIDNGSSSVSIVNKPTLVSSSMDIPVRSWSNSIKDESSTVTTETTVSTFSTLGHSQKQNKSTNAGASQNTAVINNNHSTNQGGTVAGGNNVQGGQSNQQDNKKSGEDNGNGKGLPQTGEVAATAVIGLGVVLIAVSGLVILKKKNS